MFTLFDLIRLIAAVGVAVVLGSTGWNTFGILGFVVGVPIGFVVGAMIGQMPLIACLTPNVLLLELNRRGSDIQRELPFVQSLLASDEMHRRTAGWAALNSAFPDLVDRIPAYNPTATTAECKAECKPLLNATGQSGEPEPPVTRDLKS
jgi:hypothetical protein